MNKLIIYLIFALCTIGCSSQKMAKTPIFPSFDDDNIGYYAIDDSTGEIMFEKNSLRPFQIASVAKIPSLLASLTILGPDYQFKTQIKFIGTIHDGTAKGELYLIGRGDPTFSTNDVMSLVQQLKSKKIKKFVGEFYYDQSRHPFLPSIRSNRNLGKSYNPAVSSLSINFNLDSSLKQKQTLKNPALHAAQLLKKLAAFEGLELKEPKEKVLQKEASILASHSSGPLSELVTKNFEFSNNLITELISLEASKKISPKANYQDSLKIFENWIKNKMKLSQAEFFESPSASGLSENWATPKQIVEILSWAEKNKRDLSVTPLLPISGFKGTLKDRLNDEATSLRVWAKTGTKNFAQGLSGYLYTKSGRKLIFSIFVFDLEKYSLALDDQDPEVKEWSRMAKEKTDEMINKMISF